MYLNGSGVFLNSISESPVLMFLVPQKLVWVLYKRFVEKTIAFNTGIDQSEIKQRLTRVSC